MSSTKQQPQSLSAAEQSLLEYFRNECDPAQLRRALEVLLFETLDTTIDHEHLNGPVYDVYRIHALAAAM